MVQVTVAIAHAPWNAQRRAWLAQMKRALSPIVPLVQSDPDHRGFWRNGSAAWLRAAIYPGTTHALLLTDDMLPVLGFAEALPKLVAAKPDQAICLFSMRKYVALAVGVVAWLETPDACWGGATLLPAPWVRHYILWSQQHVRSEYTSLDRRLAFWLRAQNHPVYLTVPCLLEHVGAPVSEMGHANSKRVAAALASDAREIDWTRGLNPTPKVPGSFDYAGEWSKARLDPHAPPPW